MPSGWKRKFAEKVPFEMGESNIHEQVAMENVNNPSSGSAKDKKAKTKVINATSLNDKTGVKTRSRATAQFVEGGYAC